MATDLVQQGGFAQSATVTTPDLSETGAAKKYVLFLEVTRGARTHQLTPEEAEKVGVSHSQSEARARGWGGDQTGGGDELF